MDEITGGYTPQTVSEILGLTRHTIYVYIEEGRLRAENLNAAGVRPLYRIAPAEIRRFLEENVRIATRGVYEKVNRELLEENTRTVYAGDSGG